MPWITMGANVGGASTLYRRHDLGWFRSQPGTFTDTFTNMGHPFGTTGLQSRVSKASTRSRLYGCGGFTDNWLTDEHLRVHRQGMLPPQKPPTISVGAGAIVQVPYVAFYDELTDEWSPLSAAGASVTGSVSRSWTNLPTEEVAHKITIQGVTTANATTNIIGSATVFTTLRVGDRVALSSDTANWASVRSIPSDGLMTVDRALGDGTSQTILVRPNKRASHIGLFVEVDGALPRLAVLRQIGVSSTSEATATLSLGMAAFEDFTRLPRASFNAIYHERQCVSGVVGEPDTLYVSEILFPERYGGLSFKTRNGEAIVGLAPCRNVLLAFTATNTYALRGYTEDDMVFDIVDADIGAFHHWAVQIIHGNAWVWGATGVFLWNGNYHPLISARHDEYRKDVSRNIRLFERGHTMVDTENYLCMFVLPAFTDQAYISSHCVNMQSDPVSGERTVVWWADYYETAPELNGTFKQPEWGFDVYEGRINAGAQLALPGSSLSKLYLATCDGLVKQQSEDNASNDNSATGGAGKPMTWMTGHYLLDDPGGDIQEGKTFTRLWTYMESEGKTWKVHHIGGDEECWLQASPSLALSVPFSGLPDVNIDADTFRYSPKTVHVHVKEKLSGRGLTTYYQIDSPGANIRWRGFGGEWKPGPATRGAYRLPEEG